VGVRSQFPAAVPRERAPVPIVEEAGWAPRHVWTDTEQKVSLVSTRVSRTYGP